MLYSKLGSIPKPETDGTDGWIEVEDPPVAGAGEEVVWWYPPGWVVRPVKPVKDGSVFDWSQSDERWVEAVSTEVIVLPSSIEISATGSDTVTSALGSDVTAP
jgi:hypothetical protein